MNTTTQLGSVQVQTYTGEVIDLFNPDVDKINIQDISHALANTCRWNGHTKRFYSVAQHCCMMSDLSDSNHKLTALMHDAEEAYFGDIVKPLKEALRVTCPEVYASMEYMRVLIFDKFQINPMDGINKSLDWEMLRWELENLMKNGKHITCWQPERAKDEFIARFHLFSARA